jgi:predicted ribosome quality control (RQC) complex YloA/Tae2 family protein
MFDAVTLAAVADELNETILRGRVQEIVQLDALSFGFEVYANHARHYLYVTARTDDARVHLVSQKLRASGQAPSPLLLLLRKHAEGAFIDSIAPMPNERVLKIVFDHSVEGVATLVVETMGKYSNIILVDASNMVVDAVKRVPSSINRVRVTLPNHAYAPPPPQNKLGLSEITLDDLARILDANPNAPLWQTLVKSISGVSPLLAREVEHQFHVIARSREAATKQSPNQNLEIASSHDPSTSLRSAQDALLAMTLNQLTHSPWHPSVAFEEDEPASFAPYTLTQYSDTRSFDSISVAIETFYGALDSYAAAKEPLRVAIAEARDKLARKRDQLAQSLPDANEVERLKTSGEMILAYQFQIRPGKKELEVELEDGKLKIALDARLSVVENAQKYFKDYHRAKDALERVPALLAAANAEVEYAEQMLNDLELAENRADLDAAVNAAREAGLLPEAKYKRKVAPSEPRTFTSKEGFTILVGKNARQNEEITFHRANAEDLWLHARNVPGSHVVIVRAGREVPESTIQEAAKMAARFSQARDDLRVDVIVTQRKNVHRVKGGKAGMVTVRQEQIISVALSN